MGCFICREKKPILIKKSDKDNLPITNPGKEKSSCSYNLKSDINQNKNSSIDLGYVKDIRTIKIKSNQLVLNKLINVKENYIIQEEIGSGAFGKVFRVTNKKTSFIRAMKVIKKQKGGSESSCLINEINILAKIDHPNIMKIFEHYEDELNYYIISELCSGGELYEKIVKLKCFNEYMATSIMKQLLSAVYYLHLNKVVHRDIKPENILVEDVKKNTNNLFKSSQSSFKSELLSSKPIRGNDTRLLYFMDKELNNQSTSYMGNDFSIKLIDFGVSNYFDKTILTRKVGTSYYIAPEVLNKNYNEKCDIWSCGVLLYILLSGKPPFKGKEDKDIIENVKKGKFSFESNEWDKISDEAKDLITKMLNYDYENRISAEEALKSIWFSKFDINSIEVDLKYIDNIIKNIKNLHYEQKLQHATIAFIIRHSTNHEEIHNLKEIFKKFDVNGDGRLTYDELYEGLKQTHGEILGKEELDKAIDLIDQDQNGYIEYEEFLRTSVNLNLALCEKNLQIAFDLFDKNGDQKLSRAEIIDVLGNDEIKNDIIDKMLNKLVFFEEGSITFENFKNLMIKCLKNS